MRGDSGDSIRLSVNGLGYRRERNVVVGLSQTKSIRWNIDKSGGGEEPTTSPDLLYTLPRDNGHQSASLDPASRFPE
jgi:hypothetical protein